MSYGKNCITTLFLLLVLVRTSLAKPKLKAATDGFPAGQATAEGVASDLARASMTRDAVAFRKVCIRPYGGGQGRSEYKDYLECAVYDFQDVMFVDVEVILLNGNTNLHRTMVIKDRHGKWYVHPAPNVSPLLSHGLNEESASLAIVVAPFNCRSQVIHSEPDCTGKS